jgi:hypothetical protein
VSRSGAEGQGAPDGRAGLPDEVRAFIVQALACWDTPSEVVKAVKETFGLAVSRQAVEAYDPTKRAGAALAPAHRALFEATRAAFLADSATIGISHRAVRLRTLDRLADRAEAMGNIALAAELLEQAAKEVGNAFTNKREVAGDDKGGPMRIAVTWRKPV